METPERRIVALLRGRKIRAMPAAPPADQAGVALGMSVFDLERFLDILVPPPFDAEDYLALRVVGRPGDLTVKDDPWQYELIVAPEDAGFEAHAYVWIPSADVDEVLVRLQARQA